MSRPAVVVLVWACLTGLLSAILWPWAPMPLAPALATGGALFMLAVAGFVALGARARAGPGETVQSVPDLSLPTAGAAIALSALLVGLAAGLWLSAIGATALAFALGALARERSAERRAAGRGEGG